MCRRLIYLICFALVLGLACVAYADIESGLAGYWPLDGDAKDASGNGNDGTLVGNPQWVVGTIGGALELDGAGDNVYAASVQLSTNAFTFALWFNSASLLGASSTREDLLYWQVGNGRPHITFNRSGTGEIGLWPRIGGDFDGPLTTTHSWAAGSWYHIAATFDGTSFKIYVNGKLENEVKHPGTHDAASGLLIGCRTNQRNYFTGKIDDVRFYSRALTQEEIQQVMKGIPPGVASDPSPANEATDVPRDVTLSWTPGKYAPPVNGHKVYLSENFTDVNEGIGGITQDATSYTPPQLLDFDKTYYWRVDEVNGPPDFTVYKGDVWRFTTEPFAYPIAGTSITATASSQFSASTGPQNTINGSGLDAADLHSTAETGVWLSSMTGPQPTWIQFEFDRVYKLHQMWVWNYNTSIEPVVGFGIKDATIEYSTDGANWTTLGTHQFARAPGAAGYAHNTTVDLSSVVAKYVKITANSNWGGILPQYGLSEVRFFYVPVVAREPNPASGTTDVPLGEIGEPIDVTVSWRTGREAAKHNVYLSDSNQAVIDGTAPVTTVSQARYGPLSLDLGKAYYWRVDEVNEAETPTTWRGDVWDFTTQQYFVVDDFEDYNDFEPDRIFDTWIDGWGVPANGSQVGYAEPPFAEKTVVHGGKQSMPLHYDNSTASYSEAAANVANLKGGKDWTKYGIKTLSLWFRGDPNNAAEQMYVKLNGSKVIYDGDAANLTRAGWQPWNIELSLFGINLRNVTELSIGFERSGAVGGKGKVYFDDIRLTPFSRELITPAEPSTAGLAGYWQFEGNLNDSSGNNRHGTGVGNPTFVAGKVGQAVNLTGSNYVEITGYKGVLGGGAFSIAAWVKSTSTGDVTMVCWGTQAGGQRVDFRLYQGRLRIEHGNGNLQGNTVLADGQWHHVALTVSENAPISYPAVKLYLDGKDDSQTTTDPDTFNIVANVDVNIGRRGTNNDRLFPGSLDEVRIYERALTQEEIAWLAGRRQPFDKPF